MQAFPIGSLVRYVDNPDRVRLVDNVVHDGFPEYKCSYGLVNPDDGKGGQSWIRENQLEAVKP